MIYDPIAADKMHEECGVFGIYSEQKREDIAGLVYYGLYALQHRGQESAGISVSNEKQISTKKGNGLVSEVFSAEDLASLQGNVAIGHVRYSTAGGSGVLNAQPLQAKSQKGDLAMAHNGNLINPSVLKELMEDAGTEFITNADTEVILNLLIRKMRKGLKRALIDTISAIKGSFALVLVIDDMLVGIRDPHGIRPLVMGRLQDGAYVLASESCALDAVGAEFVRDVEAGEIVAIDKNGVESLHYAESSHKAPCAFEHIYFARPDSIIDGINTYNARSEAGHRLWEQDRLQADVVIGVPDSGIPAGTGYSEASGIPFAMALVKNKYIARTFIQPSQELREKSVQVKLNPIRSMIEGKSVVVVDDSLVRGTTSKKLIKMLRNAGAREVHFRLASPAVTSPCFFGVDIAYRNELIAAKMSVDEICKEIGADSLLYLSIENLVETLGSKNFCMGCFSGTYPMSAMLNE